MFPSESQTVFASSSGNFDTLILDIPVGETFTILNTVVIKDTTQGDVNVIDDIGNIFCHANGSNLYSQCLTNFMTSGDISVIGSGNSQAQVFTSITFLPYDSSLLPNQFDFDEHLWGISLAIVIIIALLATAVIQRFYD